MSVKNTALLIPCYNAERYLQHLRKQVNALRPSFDEVLLVDDGSTDGTVGKARDLGFAIHPLGVNRGPGSARNALLEMTSAEWIHFLDADDEIAPDYLDKVRPLASQATDVVLSGCDFIGALDRELWRRWTYTEESFAANALAATIAHPVFLHCSFIRRSVALESGGFDKVQRCYEDGDFHVRLAAAGARFRCTPDVLAFSLRHQEGSGGNELYCARCRLEFLRNYRQYLERIPAEVLTKALVECGAVLHRNGDGVRSREAFELAFELGWQGPETNQIMLGILARIPNRWLKRELFLVQHRARTEVRRQTPDNSFSANR